MASKGSRTVVWVVGSLIILAAAGMVAVAPPWKTPGLESVTEAIDVTDQVTQARAPEPAGASGTVAQPSSPDNDDLGDDTPASAPAKKAAHKPAKAAHVAVPKPAAKPVAATPAKTPVAAEPKKAEVKKAEPIAAPPPKKEAAKPEKGRVPSIGIVEEAKKPAIGIVK